MDIECCGKYIWKNRSIIAGGIDKTQELAGNYSWCLIKKQTIRFITITIFLFDATTHVIIAHDYIPATRIIFL